MPEFKTIPLDKILVPERLRLVEDDHALAIQASIIEHGLINPITVRSTPNGSRPYTLVAGAHRLRAYELANDDWSRQIEALVISGDKEEAVLVEITENLFRNELTALDRALFVLRYREVWEEKYGKVKAGNRVNITQLLADEAAGGFSKHVADRLGCSPETIKLATRIGKGLDPELRKRLRGTPDADNQSLLLKLAKLEPQRQRDIAAAYEAEPDMQKALNVTAPHAKAQATKTQQQEIFERLVATWQRADEKTRSDFLRHIGATVGADIDAVAVTDAADVAGQDRAFDLLAREEVI